MILDRVHHCLQRSRGASQYLLPSKYTALAANKSTASRCTHREAAVGTLENSATMPDSLGKNWGLKPPLNPSARLPGRMRLKVSGCHDHDKSTPYAKATGTSVQGERSRRWVKRHLGAAAIRRASAAAKAELMAKRKGDAAAPAEAADSTAGAAAAATGLRELLFRQPVCEAVGRRDAHSDASWPWLGSSLLAKPHKLAE